MDDRDSKSCLIHSSVAEAVDDAIDGDDDVSVMASLSGWCS